MPHAIFDGMRDWRDALEDRTQAFADAAIDASLRLAALPGLRQAADQLNAAATSVGANHRAMRRARSDREFADQASNRARRGGRSRLLARARVPAHGTSAR